MPGCQLLFGGPTPGLGAADKGMMVTILGLWPCGHNPRMITIIPLSAASNPWVGPWSHLAPGQMSPGHLYPGNCLPGHLYPGICHPGILAPGKKHPGLCRCTNNCYTKSNMSITTNDQYIVPTSFVGMSGAMVPHPILDNPAGWVLEDWDLRLSSAWLS